MSEHDLFKIIGLVYFGIGLGILANQKFYRDLLKNYIETPLLAPIGGTAALLFGVLISTYHNIWHGWPILITILGWIALFKGITILVAPRLHFAMVGALQKRPLLLYLSGTFATLLGLLLIYTSYLYT